MIQVDRLLLDYVISPQCGISIYTVQNYNSITIHDVVRLDFLHHFNPSMSSIIP
jgi:hypothetical protein